MKWDLKHEQTFPFASSLAGISYGLAQYDSFHLSLTAACRRNFVIYRWGLSNIRRVSFPGLRDAYRVGCRELYFTFICICVICFRSFYIQVILLCIGAGSLTLARTGGGGDATSPHEFMWNGRRTVGRIALKFCIHYGASLAQPLGKKITGSGQVRAMVS